MQHHQQLRTIRPIFLLAAGIVFLAACAGQPAPRQANSLPGTLEITSSAQVASRNYVLTGTYEFPDAEGGKLEYNLNDGDWQLVDLGTVSAFSIALTLREGENKVALALTTAAEVRTQVEIIVTATLQDDGSGPADPEDVPPRFTVTSSETTTTPDYLLAGSVLHEGGVQFASYRLNDSEPVELALLSDGSFEANLPLAAGPNLIELYALDVAGNKGTATVTVTYLPQIADVIVTPEVARGGETITITGRNFGESAGTLTFGRTTVPAESWSDSEITAEVPAGLTGWLDLHIKGAVSEFTFENFFAGIEVSDSAELAEWVAREQARGTALLLSGTDYTLGFIPGTQRTVSGAFSLYGARTDDRPVTQLTITAYPAEMFTALSFGVQYQDLRIRAQKPVFLNEETPSGSGTVTSLPDGLTLSNMEFIPLNPDAPNTEFLVGQDMDPGWAPVALRMTDVHATGYGRIDLDARQIQMQDSTLKFARDFTVHASNGNLTIANSALQPLVTGPGTLGFVRSDGDALIENSSLSAHSIQLIHRDGETSYLGNEIAANSLIVAPYGNMTLGGNNFTLSEGLEIIGYGQLSMTTNDFTFDGSPSGGHAFTFRAIFEALELAFSDNVTRGNDRLFRFDGQSAEIDAHIDGNTFDADLQALGDVAVLDGVTTSGAITTSDNVWGQLESATDVAGLIEYLGGSVPGVMTVAEF